MRQQQFGGKKNRFVNLSAEFPVSDRHFRRAGMDYLDQVTITRHDSWSRFEEWRREKACRLVLFTTKAAGSYLDYHYDQADILLFGRESAGVPQAVAELNCTRSSLAGELSRTLGCRTSKAPAPVTILRAGWCPLRTTKRLPSESRRS